MTPKEKTKQIENGDNWIVEFWRIRGHEIVKTALGIQFSLHRKNPRYESLGLDLGYLEDFRKEALRLFKQHLKKVGYWKEGKTTYVIERRDYPHDELCEGTMCYCKNRAKK